VASIRGNRGIRCRRPKAAVEELDVGKGMAHRERYGGRRDRRVH
jgi:hypothetical protein